MPDPTAPSAPTTEPAGPFTSTEVKTIEISGPIKITLTTRYDSSHVPPPSGGEVRESRIFPVLQRLAEMIMAKLEEIRAAQQPDDAQH